MTPTATAYRKLLPQKTRKFHRPRWCRFCGGTGWRPVEGALNFAVTSCECRGGPRVLAGVRDFKSAATGDLE
jgi:hypothetical protein